MSLQQSQEFRDLIISGQGNRLTINQTISITPSEARSLLLDPKSPYLGLNRFEESDSVYFFGRQRLVSELLEAVARTKLTFVTGASGSGKSSLISAGLLPQLRQRARKERFRSLSLTPDRNPFESLRSSLLAQRYRHEQADLARLESPETLLNLTAALRAPSELWFVFIDQFEEMFTLCMDVRLRTAFIDGLVKLIEAPDQAVCVLLAMRADFFDRLGAHPDLAALVERSLCLVKDMQPDELRAAIEQPAAKHGVVFDEGLVETIINEVRGQPAALPLLQYTLDLLWQQSDFSTQRVLTTQAYCDLGGVLGALERRAETLFEQCTSTQQDLIRQTFLRLVNLADSASGVRAVSKRAPRRDFGSEEEARLIASLIEAKLLVASSTRPGDSDSQPTIEIAHESLLNSWTRLSQWISQAHEVIEVHGRLLADSRRWEDRVTQRGEAEAAEDLWTGSRLQQALAMRDKQDFASILGSLPATLERFLDASAVLRAQREQKEEEQRAREQRLLIEREQIRQAELSVFVENGRQSLQSGRSMAALAWLNEAYQRGAMDPCLPRLLALAIEQIGPEPACLRGHQGRVNTARFSNDGAAIVSGGHDGTARLWDAETGASRAILQGHDGPVHDVQFGLAGEVVLTCGADGTARMWDAQTGELLLILEGHEDAILKIAIDSSGRFAITASADCTARIWDLQTRSMLYTLDGHGHVVLEARFSPNDRFVVTTSGSGSVRLWNVLADPPQAMLLHGHEAAVSHACFDASGDRLVTASEDGTACVWSVEGDLLERLCGHLGTVYSASFRGTSRHHILTASQDGYARLWQSEPSKLLVMFRGHEQEIVSACFNPDCTQVLTASYDGSACVWDTESGVLLASLQGHEGPLCCAHFSPDGKKVVTASQDGTVRVWTPKSVTRQARTRYQTERLLDVATSDCRAPRVLTEYHWGVADGTVVCVRDLDSGQHLSFLKWLPPDRSDGSLQDFVAPIFGASFRSDGMRFIMVSGAGTFIWDAAQGRLLSTLALGSEKMRCCSFRSDGRLVAAGDEGGSITLWDADSGSMVKQY